MVGHLPLAQGIGVRVPIPQLVILSRGHLECGAYISKTWLNKVAFLKFNLRELHSKNQTQVYEPDLDSNSRKDRNKRML